MIAVGALASAAPTTSAPRPAREALRAFARLNDAIAAIALPDGAAESAPDDAHATDAAEAARAAHLALRRLLIDLGAPETPPPTLPPVDLPYVLACHADETLIRLTRWPGAALWPTMLLERSLYGVERAGERLPETAARMLSLSEPARRQVAAALFLAFAAGFRGGLSGQDAKTQAARLTAGLYDLAMDRQTPARLGLRERFAQTAAHTLPTPRRARARHVERAGAALGLIAAGYLAASHLLWTSTHAEVSRLADRVIADDRGAGR